MNRNWATHALVIAAVAVSGCSTKPRNFAATVSAPVASKATFEQDFRTCQQLVHAGHKGNFKGAALTGLATGAGAIGGGTAVVSLGVGSTLSGAGAAAAAAMPVVGFLAGFGVSRAIRGGKERKYKVAMTSCLSEYGYTVSDWEKIGKKDDAALTSASSASQVEGQQGPEPVSTVPSAEVAAIEAPAG